MILGNLKMRTAFGYADKIKAQYVILIAPEEYNKGNIVVKDLRSDNENNRIQKKISLIEFINNYNK